MLLFFLGEKEKLGKLPLSTTPCFLGGQDNVDKMKLVFYFFLILKSLILTCIPKHEPPSHLPPHNISLGHPHALAPSMLYPASDIDWQFFFRIFHLGIWAWD